ncbi:MAG: 2-amino-4-hydroxy-6-hydroxymethyldihydropteridine diphosphokinase, partial [Phycisphaerales bacterium]|nr:2-amino-4-hydroxy-6-hydroxymethyldihydropteridine diphosphokinase [Phycisphaerales bacterium]
AGGRSEVDLGAATVKRIGYLGLGSNVGDRMAALLGGAAALDELDDIAVRRMATVLETEPVGVEGHGAYLNTVVEIETTKSPVELLMACLLVERGMGRVRQPGGACLPRRLDIDVLLLGECVHGDGEVTVPHPRMHERAFVLVPMVELAADVVHPVSGLSMHDLLQAEIEMHGPVEDRCAILKPGPLLDDGPASGPAGLTMI